MCESEEEEYLLLGNCSGPDKRIENALIRSKYEIEAVSPSYQIQRFSKYMKMFYGGSEFISYI